VKEALEACAAGAEIVMLDNFTPERIPAAAQQIKDQYPHVLIEASGVSLPMHVLCECVIDCGNSYTCLPRVILRAYLVGHYGGHYGPIHGQKCGHYQSRQFDPR